MSIPKEPFYGKTVELPLKLGKNVGLRVALMAILPLVFILVPSLARHSERLLIVRICGFVLVPLCAFSAFSLYRASRWTDCRFKLTRKNVTFPLYPVYRQASRTLALEDLRDVGVGFVGRFIALRLVDQERTYMVPYNWFPPGWGVHYIAARVQTRRILRQEGKLLEPTILAGLEAHLDQADPSGVDALAIP